MSKSAIRLPVLLRLVLTISATAFAQSHASVSAAEVNGTYRMNFRGKYKAMANTIKLSALGGGKLRFSMDLIYPYTLRNGEISVNMGGLDGEANIKGDTAVYKAEGSGECRITFKFVRAGSVKVTQEGSDAACGFGHNVNSSGTYRKVSGKKPIFEDE